MIKNKKIIAIVMLILLFFSSFQNVIYAATYNDTLNIFNNGYCEYTLQFKRSDGVWSYVTCVFAGYEENGKIYPAYCLNRGLDGVGEISNYNVNLTDLISDVRLWRVAINGYPYKTPAEMGVYNEYDAFLATKQAIYSILYDNDVDSYYRGGNERGWQVFNAIKYMVNEGRNGTYTPESANVTLSKVGSLKDEGNYYSQEYSVNSRVSMSSYTITGLVNSPSGTYTTDMSNNSKTTFNGGNNFKVMIPKSSMSSDINLKINVQTKCKSYPVFFGATTIAGTQNYLIATDPYGDESGQGNLNIKTNTGKIEVTKVDDETNAKIQGTTFQLCKTDGTPIASATSNSNGIATFSNIYQGNYKIREISTPDNYILNSQVFDISVEYNKTSTITVKNTHKKGNLKIIKTDLDTSEPIADTEFELTDLNGNVVAKGTTSNKGELQFNNIRVGKYKLKETKSNKNYVSNSKVYDITIEYNKTTTQEITNEYKKGNIKINKTDAETGKGIAGVVFELKKFDGTLVGTATTNDKGEAYFNRIRIGDYKITEKSTDKRYILNTNTFDIEVEYDKTKTMDITNEHKRGNLSVFKVDKDNHKVALGNVIFDLFSYEFNRVIGSYTTNVDGELTINNLRIGKYSLIEKNTGKWYNLADDTDVNIEWNKTTNTTIENELKKGQIKIIKVDEDNNEVKLAGVKFNVLDKDNKILETITTDENGEAYTSRYAVRDYDSLKLQESETLWNYVLNDEITTIELKAEEITNITFENESKKGQIKVIKVDKDNNEIKLEGVKFEIYNKDGELVDTLITDENGEAVSKRLRIDKNYTLKETKTLQDYDLNEEAQTITLEENQIKDVVFENELKKGKIQVIKVDMDDNEVRLEGIKFEIYDNDNNLIDTLITDPNGETTSIDLRVDKEYTIKETETLSNYVLNEEEQKITLKPAEIKTLTFENEKIKGYIQINKTSSEYNKYSELEKGSPLADVSFEIYDSENNLVDTIKTDETGKAITKELLKGNYTIKEIESAKYYLLNENIYNAEIKNHQEIVNVDITNDNVNIDVEIEKKGFIETQSKDDIFYNFSNIKNKSNVPLDNFTWQDKLPTDAVRINRIYTGTWNEDLEYGVFYKTNKSEEYKIFKDKLSTQKIYELDFTELDLEEDEYVTEYEFRFGKVKIGFQEVEKPILYCDIVDGLGNGYVFTNHTKVSGTYFEKYIEDTDDWTTITYFKEIKVNNVLPRTRYIV